MAYKKTKKDGSLAMKPGRKPDPDKVRREPMFYKGVPRPHVWKSGTDEYRHKMYTPWMRARAQANFRGEEWALSFNEFYELWKDEWPNRGRAPDDICMTRDDFDGPWDTKNTFLLTRKEHLKRQGEARAIKGPKYYKKGPPGNYSKSKKTPTHYTKMKVQK